ncbi:hypothetical protein, partial [Emticicia sp. W12TSBA100-4]|uniref:hypothetical protein n=1 Tax=Emticicia sp. W12TSBA100-4 TaxID=3160965 RepID=UPI003306466E
NGGVFVTNGISIPVGQTGNLSYRIFRYSNSGFSNFSDLIGKTVTFTVMLKTSADLVNLKGIVSSINVTRTTGNVSNQGANKLNTVVNSELIKTTFSYTFTANDTSFDVYSQVTNTVTSSSVMSFEILNVFYTVDQIPSEYGTP